MKKIKYLFMFLIALCFMPNMVNATQNVYFKPYKVGDKITVTLDKDEKVKGSFIVIESSEEKNVTLADDYDFGSATEDYQYVTAIYDGTVGDSAFSKDEKVATSYEKSLAASNLLIKTTNLGWINYKEGGLRLLTHKDIISMIKSLPQEAQDEIYNKDEENSGPKCVTNSDGTISCEAELAPIGTVTIDWTAVKKYLPFLFINNSYWLGQGSIYGTYCPPGQSCAAVMRNWATGFGANGIYTALATDTLSLRPVITIHKGFVEGGMICNCTDCEDKKEEKFCPNDKKISIQACIDGGQTEEACIKKLCPGTEKTENPKTGSYLPLLGIVVAGIIASCVCVATRNKTYFKKVK